MVRLEKTLEGSILDIGGGGEGVIGRLYTDQVTAIDNRQEELDEAPGGYRKLLMDAGALAFADASFDHVTAFYALMYVEKDQHEKVVREACRRPAPGRAVLHLGRPHRLRPTRSPSSRSSTSSRAARRFT